MTIFLIGTATHKGQKIVLRRDDKARYYIEVDEKRTQSRLNANEMARWFLNAINDEV